MFPVVREAVARIIDPATERQMARLAALQPRTLAFMLPSNQLVGPFSGVDIRH
jgi:hypothetical protein